MSIVIKNFKPVGVVSHQIRYTIKDCTGEPLEYILPIIAYCEIVDTEMSIDFGQPQDLETIVCAAVDIEGILTPVVCLDVGFEIEDI